MANSPYQNMWNFEPRLDPRYQKRMWQQQQPMMSVMPQQPSLGSQVANTALNYGAKKALGYGIDQLGGATGLTNPASSSTSGLSSYMPSSSTLGTVALNAGGLLGAANIGSHLLRNRQQNPITGALSGAAAGAAAGSWFPVVGTAIGGVLGGLGGLASSFMGRHQHKDEIERDKIRSALAESKFLNPDDTLTVGGKTYGNFRMDGKTPGYNIDFNNANAGNVVGDIQGLGAILAGNTGKSAQDTTGYLTNAVLQGASAKDLYDKIGGQRAAYDKINALQQQGAISPELARVYQFGINNVYGNKGYNSRGILQGNNSQPIQQKPVVSNIVQKPSQSTPIAKKLAQAVSGAKTTKSSPTANYGGFFGNG